MKKIVTFGGGTGSFAVLRGLKQYPYDITAVSTMFDSGGSSGLLRDEHGVLPPGDVRRCLVALSEGWREETMRQLFNYRFENGNSLKGHSFGNILLTALAEIKGDEASAIEEAGQLLNIRGKVLPVSIEKAVLCAELEDGTVIEGENNIDIPKHDTSLKIKEVFLKPSVKAYEKVHDAIYHADVIIMGPGDMYTSLVPNLLTEGVKEAVQKSNAQKIYIVNLFTKPGETDGYKASDFTKTALRYSGLDKFDVVIYNDAELPEDLVSRYKEKGQLPVEMDELCYDLADQCESGRLYSGDDILRHDSRRLAEVLNRVIEKD